MHLSLVRTPHDDDDELRTSYAVRRTYPTMAAQSAKDAIFVKSEAFDGIRIAGPDFNTPMELQDLLNSYAGIGFQATGLARAMELIEKMVRRLRRPPHLALNASSLQRTWRLSDEPLNADSQTEELDPTVRAATKCTIFLGYTSNLVSSGLREIIRFLVQHNYVSCLVTTAGGIEEDLIKCLGPTFSTPNGVFNLDGATLRRKGLNRIGNLLVPNDNYCKFEDWVVPILDKMVEEQEGEERVKWSPSKVIARLGKEIDDESSILYWAQKVSIHLLNSG
jgi:deoxyhypusine synthase